MRKSAIVRTAAASLMLACTLSGPTALASPGSGIMSEVFTTSSLREDTQINHDRVKVQTKDDVAVRVQKLTFAAGGRTGWHHHPGAVVVAVAAGSVTLVDHDCSTKTYGPGSPNGSVFIEGHDDGHEARSEAGAIVYATYLAPDAVFRVENDAVSCP